MADEKDKQPKDETPKPRTRRSTAAKKTAAKPKAKPKAKAKDTDEDAKPARPRRRTTTAKPKKEEAPKAETAPAEATEEKADEKPATKAPARRRRATPKRDAPRKPAAAPVVTARAKYVRTSARKARLVIDHVRGKPIAEAQAVLRHSPRGVARDLERLLKSAVANAENNHDLVGDDLYIKEFYADEGPTLKRFRPRAQGRAYRIRKRTSHLTVALTPKE